MKKKRVKGNRTRSQALHTPIINHSNQESLPQRLDESNLALSITDYRVETVVDFMTRDPCQEHVLNDLASGVNLSPSRFRHLFKEQTGQTFVQYRRDLKLQAAKNLLETTFLTVQEVRNKVGVIDECQFSRAFKRAFRMTPAQYRKYYLAVRCKGHQENLTVQIARLINR